MNQLKRLDLHDAGFKTAGLIISTLFHATWIWALGFEDWALDVYISIYMLWDLYYGNYIQVFESWYTLFLCDQ